MMQFHHWSYFLRNALSLKGLKRVVTKLLVILHENLILNVPFLWPCQPVWRPAWQCWHLCPQPWSTSRIVAFWHNFSTSQENRNEFSCEKKSPHATYTTQQCHKSFTHTSHRGRIDETVFTSRTEILRLHGRFFWDGKNSLHTLSTLLSQNSYTHTENLLIANKRASTTLRSSS